jgi:hypothetical protein
MRSAGVQPIDLRKLGTVRTIPGPVGVSEFREGVREGRRECGGEDEETRRRRGNEEGQVVTYRGIRGRATRR